MGYLTYSDKKMSPLGFPTNVSRQSEHVCRQEPVEFGKKLTCRFRDRDFRLEDVEDEVAEKFAVVAEARRTDQSCGSPMSIHRQSQRGERDAGDGKKQRDECQQ